MPDTFPLGSALLQALNEVCMTLLTRGSECTECNVCIANPPRLFVCLFWHIICCTGGEDVKKANFALQTPFFLFLHDTCCPGGEDVHNANPWFVFIVLEPAGMFSKFRCGASLINRN